MITSIDHPDGRNGMQQTKSQPGCTERLGKNDKLESRKVLVLGPTSAKTEFIKYLERHVPETRARVAGVETMDRMTDRQIVAKGRRYFAQEDRMEPQRG
jgi:stalled ribosome rescue protein Dom34